MKIPIDAVSFVVDAMPDHVRVRLVTGEVTCLNRVHAHRAGSPAMLTMAVTPFSYRHQPLAEVMLKTARHFVGPLLAIKRRPLTVVLGIGDWIMDDYFWMGVVDEEAS